MHWPPTMSCYKLRCLNKPSLPASSSVGEKLGPVAWKCSVHGLQCSIALHSGAFLGSLELLANTRSCGLRSGSLCSCCQQKIFSCFSLLPHSLAHGPFPILKDNQVGQVIFMWHVCAPFMVLHPSPAKAFIWLDRAQPHLSIALKVRVTAQLESLY